ncbi:hypothetical protein A2U01_0075056, partial [Trifolium medium]|nr:hypothetical protein [Trifolium medium]
SEVFCCCFKTSPCCSDIPVDNGDLTVLGVVFQLQMNGSANDTVVQGGAVDHEELDFDGLHSLFFAKGDDQVYISTWLCG